MEETKNPIRMSPECERLGLRVVGMKMTLGFTDGECGVHQSYFW